MEYLPVVEFRCLLVKLAHELSVAYVERLRSCFKMAPGDSASHDGCHILFSLEAMGHIHRLHPDTLSEALSTIGRLDLEHHIMEYKEFLQKGGYSEEGGTSTERGVAAQLLFAAESTSNEEERDMFTMALTQTAHLVEHTESMRKTIDTHGDRMIEAALRTALGETKSLSRTIKQAASVMRKEGKRTAKKRGRGDDRSMAAKLLSEAEQTADKEERKWKDMCAMALTQTAQLADQMQLLHATMETHSDSKRKNTRILHSIKTAQDELEFLSGTLKRAVHFLSAPKFTSFQPQSGGWGKTRERKLTLPGEASTDMTCCGTDDTLVQQPETPDTFTVRDFGTEGGRWTSIERVKNHAEGHLGSHFSTVHNRPYPGLHFVENAFRERITHKAATIAPPDMGIFLDLPGEPSCEDKTIDLLIHPCFSGPFQLPEDYKPASPAYLVHPCGKVTTQKSVTIIMHHYANLVDERDCEDMCFLSAKPVPKYRHGKPVYVFQHIRESRGIFRTKGQEGEIQLKHFCLLIIGRRRRISSMYSARLYRSRSQAVFCMCLDHPVYTKCCDQNISEGYTDMSSKDEAKVVQRAKLTGEEVELSNTNPDGWSINFDKKPAKIQKRDIDVPASTNFSIKKLSDYPPRCRIDIQRGSDEASLERPMLLVQGLDITDCSFQLVALGAGASLQASASSLAQSSTSTSPNHYRVLTALLDLTTEWSYLGMALGLENSELQAIEHNHPSDTKRCLTRVVDNWLKQRGREVKEVSWKTLHDALMDPLVRRPDLARQVQDQYLS